MSNDDYLRNIAAASQQAIVGGYQRYSGAAPVTISPNERSAQMPGQDFRNQAAQAPAVVRPHLDALLGCELEALDLARNILAGVAERFGVPGHAPPAPQSAAPSVPQGARPMAQNAASSAPQGARPMDCTYGAHAERLVGLTRELRYLAEVIAQQA